MDNEKAIELAKQWEAQAARYERRNASINRSACHEGKRQLKVGLAAQARACAEQLRELIGKHEPSLAPEASDASDA